MSRFSFSFSLFLAALVLGAGLVLPTGTVYGQSKPVDAADKAAQKWFKLLDAGDYAATWKQGSSVLKSNKSKKQWVKQMKRAQKRVDALKSRSLKDATQKTNPPGSPDGSYVIAKYNAQYGSKSMIETVTLKKGSSGWKVADYFIRPAK